MLTSQSPMFRGDRLLNSDCEAPYYPRLLRTFRVYQELVRIINEPKIVDFELLSLVNEAKDDPEYVKLVSALENKSGLPVFSLFIWVGMGKTHSS